MKYLSSVTIQGYRGFAAAQEFKIAIPNGVPGSGITYLVGSNNAGKSSFVECLSAISRRRTPSITEGRRNKNAGDRVSIELLNTDDEVKSLKSVEGGGSETVWTAEEVEPGRQRFFVLPSRRQFNPLFGKGSANREQYAQNRDFEAQRGQAFQFEQRLFNIQENRGKFDKLLSRVMNKVPEWYIDQNDSGQYFLKFKSGPNFHNSDGMGEGLVSLFVIIDAFYDSRPGDIIVIDEPELSLHPQYQRRLSDMMVAFSKDRQVIISTHSPLMLNWSAILDGAAVCRVYQESDSSNVASMSSASTKMLEGLLRDQNNPHVLGLDASEAFFLEDGIVLVEGQEDVVFFRKLLADLEMDFNPSFFGWGVGGADKMKNIASMLQELGYKRVVGILDNDKAALRDELDKEFLDFSFYCIEADDIRTKKSRPAVPAKDGLLDEKGKIKDEYVEATEDLLTRVKADLEPGT